MQEFALARAAGVALSGAAGREGGARCANRLVGVFARLIWKGRGAGRGRALQRYTGRHRKNGERELKLNGSTRLRAAIRAAVSP